MFSKRRHPKALYGRAKTVKQSDLLWNEAMTASPIRKPVFLPDAEPSGGVDESVAGEVKEDAVLGSIDSNKLHVSAMRYATKKCVPRIVDETSGEHGDEEHPDNIKAEEESQQETPVKAGPMLSPLTASTPIDKRTIDISSNLTRSHIRFSSRESTPALSESSISTLESSDLSGIASTDGLQQLTEAFEDLTTIGRPSLGNESSVASEKDLQDIQSLLSLCHQLEAENFVDYMTTLSSTSIIRKLGEASFSEVYVGTSIQDDVEETVYKVIPFGDGAEEVPIHDVIQELRISSAMADVPGYVKIRGMRIVRGEYPQELLTAWDAWNEIHESESDRPDWYKDTQRYCIVALENGGTDLEHYAITSWSESLQLLKGIVDTLALGEKEREFEHRDLHWGNILVKQDQASGKPAVTIIDYTLSRARVSDQLSDIAFYGFTDRAIFEAEGEDYQFDIYRLMRDSITQDKGSDSQENWIDFYPTTNALWIHYLVDKLLYHKDLKKPALRTSKRQPVLQDEEIAAWRALESAWKLLNPRRKYKPNEVAIDSAGRVSQLIC